MNNTRQEVVEARLKEIYEELIWTEKSGSVRLIEALHNERARLLNERNDLNE
jgi:hypothetical protein